VGIKLRDAIFRLSLVHGKIGSSNVAVVKEKYPNAAISESTEYVIDIIESLNEINPIGYITKYAHDEIKKAIKEG
jgi:hypothetical protein